MLFEADVEEEGLLYKESTVAERRSSEYCGIELMKLSDSDLLFNVKTKVIIRSYFPKKR